MRNQEQPKDSNWYNNRLVLLLLFFVMCLFVPAIMTIWAKTEITINDIGIIGGIYLLILLLGSLVLLGIYFWGIKKEVKNAIKDVANQIIKKEVIEEPVKAVTKSVITEKCISEAIKGATETEEAKNSINGAVTNAIANVVISEEVINKLIQTIPITKDEIISTINNAVETKMDAFLQTDEAKGVFKGEIKDITTQDLIKSAIKDAVLEKGNSIEQARLDESEEKKYRFVERVVEEICKGNKSGNIDICNLRVLIGSILNDDKGCSVDITEDGDNAKLVITDRDCKQEILVFDNTKNAFTSDGDFTLCNGFVITINSGRIERIRKP